MPFGMQTPSAGDFADIVKYDANAGRMFKIDYDPATREKTPVDIAECLRQSSRLTLVPSKSATGDSLQPVPLPCGPRRTAVTLAALRQRRQRSSALRPVVRTKIFGKVLGDYVSGHQPRTVYEPIEDLYTKFRKAPEAHAGKIPIVELSRTLPVMIGRGQRQRTLYAPCFKIVGWTDRVPEMGERTVPPPKPAPAVDMTVNTSGDTTIDDEIPW